MWLKGYTPWNKGTKGVSKGRVKGEKSINTSGKNHWNWKGDNVGYAALHEWIKKRFSKTELCQECNKLKPYDLANISQKYKRDISDWEWLCRKCHMTKDGRLKNLIKNGNPTGRKHSQETKNKMSEKRKKYWKNYACANYSLVSVGLLPEKKGA